ncbi:hypothetical protein BRADI_3g22407v3 [Brachypodium distachyon]|uniref:Uncharacterized protein n=1 Tax=Brachypodium distachyon TaxID=15368 RepID=A0A2K2CYT7_BRADI|nr:hypothetical protein BRADI_3g22407v3 [Brachypodium distachyon]
MVFLFIFPSLETLVICRSRGLNSLYCISIEAFSLSKKYIVLVCLSQQWPELLSFAINKDIVTSSVFHCEDMSTLFHLLLSLEAHMQYQELLNLIDQLILTISNDQWTYLWNSSGFSTSKTYLALIDHIDINHAAN